MSELPVPSWTELRGASTLQARTSMEMNDGRAYRSERCGVLDTRSASSAQIRRRVRQLRTGSGRRRVSLRCLRPARVGLTSGQMSALLGHSHPEIVATVRDGRSAAKAADRTSLVMRHRRSDRGDGRCRRDIKPYHGPPMTLGSVCPARAVAKILRRRSPVLVSADRLHVSGPSIVIAPRRS